jgi:hypothetical protein
MSPQPTAISAEARRVCGFLICVVKNSKDRYAAIASGRNEGGGVLCGREDR